MICKKCGREYEDDMPNCLWCDAPNDGQNEQNDPVKKATSTSSTQQSEFVQDEPENVSRGKSAILWTKIFLAITVITGLFSEYIIHIFKPFTEMAEGSAPVQPPNLTQVLATLFFLFLIFCIGIVSLVVVYKFCKWLYYTTKFLRKYTSTKFSPWAAVICTMIPWICGFLDYFIFKDLLAQQKKVLMGKGEKFTTVDKKILTSIPILTALILVPSLLSNIASARIASIVLFAFCVGAYIKTMETIIENEKTLHAMREREIVNRKVEEILAQRENS